jgi:uncharacterized protein YjbI with pentapeptide repeats
VADPEHLEILRQSVEKWNQWRRDNPDVQPDLREADLRDADLRDADLRDADISEAILIRADLGGAILVWTDLGGANLSGANLREANLNRAKLGWAKLIGVNLEGATLIMVELHYGNLNDGHLKGTNLERATLCEADLIRVDIEGANLSRADLRHANLTEANLRRANLQGANCEGAILKGADLTKANLRQADLTETDLEGTNLGGANVEGASLAAACLFDAKLDGANLTRCHLWETQRTGWSIKDVRCKSVYWDRERKERTLYSLGEFERLFSEKTRICLFYKDGINPLEIATLPALIKHLEESHPGCNLRLKSIHDDAGGVVVELTIENFSSDSSDELKQLKTALESEAQQKVEYQRLALKEREDRLRLEGKKEELDALVDKLLHKIGDTYNLINSQAGSVGPGSQTRESNFNLTHTDDEEK